MPLWYYASITKEAPMQFSRSRRRPARQEWSVGQTVSVGFLRDLTIIGREKYGDAWRLRAANGAIYSFQPHVGIERVA